MRQATLAIGLVALLMASVTSGARTREGTVRTEDGVDLYYREVGAGGEIVIIPVAVWLSPHFDSLASPNRRIIYYDPRGRGRSGVGDLNAVSLERATQDLEALRAGLKIDKMALVGWSGYGMEMVVYALAHPGRVSRIVQLNPVPPRLEPFMSTRTDGMNRRTDQAAWQRYEQMAKDGADQRLVCRQMNRALAPSWFAKPAAAAELIDRVCESPNEWPENQNKFFGAFLPSLANLDVRPRLIELRMPRLIIHGDRDLIPLEGVREWLTGKDDARLLVIGGADHGSFLDAPRVVIPAIQDFLSGKWPVPAQSAASLSVTLAAARQHSSMKDATHEDHQAQMRKDEEMKHRGAAAMGFDQEATTHHFFLYRDGGAIEVGVKDASDGANRESIRTHLRTIAAEFSRGEFMRPFQTHAEEPPGVRVMKARRTAIAYRFEETPDGGRVRIGTTDPEALSAVHAFLRYQIREHATGDPIVEGHENAKTEKTK